eukprot:gnl/TRDRNA2_/TRDRNA2_35352_c0_seq1.p1 gnl/TRDRNA2_/TRDRNA2_35352_c0~~gnl/TRDRNA2_/TRDRNA2_35352_c0_seq1.p1  ORF type:complete len:288 (+),score=65.08 gnl/TRDRNA2_/TRDRNA2_35352_c0_seq1:72-935(+)
MLPSDAMAAFLALAALSSIALAERNDKELTTVATADEPEKYRCYILGPKCMDHTIEGINDAGCLFTSFEAKKKINCRQFEYETLDVEFSKLFSTSFDESSHECQCNMKTYTGETQWLFSFGQSASQYDEEHECSDPSAKQACWSIYKMRKSRDLAIVREGDTLLEPVLKKDNQEHYWMTKNYQIVPHPLNEDDMAFNVPALIDGEHLDEILLELPKLKDDARTQVDNVLKEFGIAAPTTTTTTTTTHKKKVEWRCFVDGVEVQEGDEDWDELCTPDSMKEVIADRLF